MTQPKSIEAYNDCETQFEKALVSEHGIAMTLESPSQAVSFVQKMNTYRTMLRKRSRGIYPDPLHPLHGTSPYDAFKVSIDKQNPSRVLIRKYAIKVLTTEPLGPEE